MVRAAMLGLLLATACARPPSPASRDGFVSVIRTSRLPRAQRKVYRNTNDVTLTPRAQRKVYRNTNDMTRTPRAATLTCAAQGATTLEWPCVWFLKTYPEDATDREVKVKYRWFIP